MERKADESDSDSSDCQLVEKDLPTAVECEERCQRFAEVTGTDTALAMFFLQDRDWNLSGAEPSKKTTQTNDSFGALSLRQDGTDTKTRRNVKEQMFLSLCLYRPDEGRALDAFFDTGGTGSAVALDADRSTTKYGTNPRSARATSQSSVEGCTRSENTTRAEGTREKGIFTHCHTEEKQDSGHHRIRLLSWNIDGLDSNNIKTRAKAVVNTITAEKPDVVFVQEMVPVNEAVLREGLSSYVTICGGTGSKEGYYTGIFLHKQHTILEDYEIKPFFSSRMGRSLLIARCLVKEVPMTLITGHLESTKTHDEERKHQLVSAFRHMAQAPDNHTVVFGGDLNLRDKELEAVGGIPSGIVDLWEATGKRKEARSTWDTFRNDNLGYEGRSRAALRFDRLYMRPAKPAPKVKAVYFELVGLQRIPNIMRFPSDHWGILAHFDITV